MLTQARLKELFTYSNGNLIRLTSRGNAKKGAIAGKVENRGYLRMAVDGKHYLNHRLVWLYHEGYFPEQGIDHINRDKTDNRITNLRAVSQACNTRNVGNSTKNRSGVKGVHFLAGRNKWVAQIRTGGANCAVKLCDSFAEAVAHRLAVEQALGWHTCDTLSPAAVWMAENIVPAYK